MVTSSPEATTPDPRPDFEALRDAVLRRVVDRLAIIRLRVGPVLVAALSLVAWLSPDPWRVGLGAVLSAVLLVAFPIEAWRLRSGRAGPLAYPANLLALLLVQLGVVVATGGMQSPGVVALPMVAMQMTLVFGPSRWVGAVVAPHLLVIGALVGVELATGASAAVYPVNTPGAWLALQFGGLCVVEIGAVGLGAKLRHIVGTIVSDLIDAYDSERSANEGHAREVLAMTGEIAHELKNPLASVKGLAALLAKDAEGRSAERLQVLREEVDRMQVTLERFLDLSRPLVPLAVEDVALDDLAADVGSMCEGMWLARDVQFRVSGAGRARADRRKLRQVLVNLVQNAVEAAPPGTEIEVAVSAGSVEVRDRGAGVPQGLPVFEPGITTRAHGNGLGLAIARGLVEQHGGALTLAPRVGGGTVATVTLPEAA